MYILKVIIFLILSIFLVTYACESSFSIINLIKSKDKNALTNKTTNANYISIKIIK